MTGRTYEGVAVCRSNKKENYWYITPYERNNIGTYYHVNNIFKRDGCNIYFKTKKEAVELKKSLRLTFYDLMHDTFDKIGGLS